MISPAKLLFRNSAANLLGQLIYPILTLALVPFYIKRLGIDGYGLLGFFATLVALLGIVTKGLSTAMMREISRRSASEIGRQSLPSFVLTFERAYWAAGTLVAIGLAAASVYFSEVWLKTETISRQTVLICLLIISLRIALTFPAAVYQSVLSGLQEQVALNVIGGFFAVWTAVLGAAAILIWNHVVAFYCNELINTAISTFVIRQYSMRRLPARVRGDGPRWSELRALLRESLGLMWTNGTSGFLIQFDKVAISRILDIVMLGVYTAATAGGRLLGMLYSPFLQASYPQLCQLVTGVDRAPVWPAVERNSRIVAVVCLAVGAPLFVFAPDLLRAWTGNERIALEGTLAMRLSLTSGVLVGLSGVLYQLQVAMGRVRYQVGFNAAALLWCPALMWFATSRLGIEGAALVWLAFCCMSWIFHQFVTFRILRSSGWWWSYLRGLALPLAVCAASAVAGRLAADALVPQNAWGRVLFAVISGGICLVLGALLSFGGKLPAELRFGPWRER